MIGPALWDEAWFVPLSRDSKLFWCWAKSTDLAPVPGLLRGAVDSFASALRYTHEEMMIALRELIDRGRVEVDDPHRLLRLVDVPRRPGNPNVLLGWFRRWRALPECDLKYAHIDSLRQSLDGKWGDRWMSTFGSVEIPVIQTTNQASLFGQESLSKGFQGIICPKDNHHHQLDEFRKALGSLSKGPDEDPDPDPYPEQKTPTLSEAFPDEAALWGLQETLRDRLGLATAPADRDDLERVRALLAEGFTTADAERALRANYAACERNTDKCRFFNGVTNWVPKNFRFALRLAPPANGGGRPSGVDGAEHSRELAEDSLSPADAAAEVRRLREEKAL